MRVRLKGINCVKTRLASGRTVAYWYAWKSGPRLRGEPGSPEFIASYNEAVARKVTPPSGVLLSVLQGYQTSENFRQIAKSTRRSYIALIKRIEAKFGSFPLSAMTDRRTRGVFMAWRDELAIELGSPAGGLRLECTGAYSRVGFGPRPCGGQPMRKRRSNLSRIAGR